MSLPLTGIRILSIEQFGAGPFGTLSLADLGAEVIKIEDPTSGGDVARYVPPFEIEADSLYFQSFNRGKMSIALDLRAAGGREVFEDLVKVSHGVFNNLRGDLPGKLKLRYRDLASLNPAIVTCSLSGFGTAGPMASFPGYDALIQGMAGYMSVTGEPGAPPAKCGVSIIDFAAGFAAGLGMTAALLDAQRTGLGRDVDVNLFDTGVSMLSYFAAWNLNRRWQAERTANSSHQTLVPSQNFRTADGWIVVFCAKESFWQRLCEAMGEPELAHDARFARFGDRYTNRSELIPLLQDRFERRSTATWLEALEGKVPVAPVNSVDAAMRLAEQHGAIVSSSHPEYGEIRTAATPYRFEGAPNKFNAGPSLGQHTDQLLTNLLNYSPQRVNSLRASGAVGHGS